MLNKMTNQVSPLIVILGQTASGKSELAIKLAEHFRGEIICADSMTIYKGFNIGTAKPTQNEQQAIPHHLIDIAEPGSNFNTEAFQRFANNAIQDIASRHKLPFLVGGSGLYIDSVLFSYKFLSPPTEELREKLNQMDLHQLLQEADKLNLNTEMIDAHNRRRLVRFIESNGKRSSKLSLRPHTVIIGLQMPREEFDIRIERRVNAMIANGLEDEVRNLSQKYGWNNEQLKAVGYREWQNYFSNTINHSELVQLIIRDTLALAKKQRTWFKRNKSIHWFSTGYNIGEIVDLVTTELNK